LGIGNNDTFRAASILAGGVARQGETCGAIIGALSALGLLIGRARIEDVATSRAAFDAGIVLRSKIMDALNAAYEFESPLGSTLCRHIQEKIFGRFYDLSNKDEFQAFLAAGGRGDNGCPNVCRVAARETAIELARGLRPD
jgi:hypothetical protein